jgi:hypothetical protein|tara:strand:+ start:194 stop:454 length:261 start_codon:yes stop_codon:yes gene_type:complete
MNKYIDDIGEKLNDISMNGFCDDTSGSVEYGLWSGKVNAEGMMAIIQEDDQGFFDYTLYANEAELNQAWDRIIEADSQLMEGIDNE